MRSLTQQFHSFKPFRRRLSAPKLDIAPAVVQMRHGDHLPIDARVPGQWRYHTTSLGTLRGDCTHNLPPPSAVPPGASRHHYQAEGRSRLAVAGRVGPHPYDQDTVYAAWVAAVPFLLESNDNLPPPTAGRKVPSPPGGIMIEAVLAADARTPMVIPFRLASGPIAGEGSLSVRGSRNRPTWLPARPSAV